MEQEKIVAAACKVHNDIDENTFILTGDRHVNIRETLHNFHIKSEIVDGFWTNKDRFVNRIEAKKIAIAANQLIVPIEETYPELYSEDVW